MGKKSAPAAPAAPDYTALAEKTGQSNLAAIEAQTRANRVNQVNPWGSVNWSQDANGNWTQTETLNPQTQAALDAQMALQNRLSQGAMGMADQAINSMQRPIDTSGLPALQGVSNQGLSQWGTMDPRGQGFTNITPDMLMGYGRVDPSQIGGVTGQLNTQGLGGWGSSMNPGGSGPGGGQGGFDLAGMLRQYGGNFQNMSAGLPDLGSVNAGALPGMGHIDTSGLMQLGDPGFGAVQQIQDAMMSRLGPQMEAARNQEVQRLKSQGITEGSPAWNASMANLSKGDNDARMQALLGAAGEYGNIFNRQLAGRGQQFGEQSTIANLANANRAQGWNEQMGAANLALQNRNQLFGERATAGQLQNQQMSTMGSLSNAAAANQLGWANLASNDRQAQFQQALQTGQFQNAAQAQQFAQMMGLGEFQNATQQQQYQQLMGMAGLANQNNNDQFSQNMVMNNYLNALRGQQFQEQLGMSQANAGIRAQGLNELYQAQQAPLNNLNALLGGMQVQNPNFQGYASQGNAGGVDYLGAGQSQYQAAMNAFNAQQQARANSTSGLLGLVGTIGGAALGGPLGASAGGFMGGLLK